jgi:CubicO group peptidase (beta-lactamase class C family)
VKTLILSIGIALSAAYGQAQAMGIAVAMNDYLQPYVRSGNFSGGVLVAQHGKIVFEKSYGFSDREKRIPNRAATQFHIASISMQFTAAAIMRLVDKGSISLDDQVGAFLPEIEGANKITIRDLLIERSGLPDINALPDYDEVLQHHQTPTSLIAKIGGHPLVFEPGTKFVHEEHSAYNLLALIVEKKTGLPFAAAVKRLVFQPMGLDDSGVDDDVAEQAIRAKGYEPEGTYGLRAAKAIHWSAKSGNASVFTTARDEAHWVSLLFRERRLSAAFHDAIVDASMRVGYGWFKGANERFGETTYSMNGRAPGFASFVLYLPRTQSTVVVLSNIYSSATTTIGYDIAAIARGLPYKPFRPTHPAPSAAELKRCQGTFQFGPDFYQANANLELMAKGSGLFMRWPSGEVSTLIPMSEDSFVDRSYWEQVKINRDASSQPETLIYDHFQGKALHSRER